MELPVDYATALELYPEAVAEAVAMLRKSRSKHRKADPVTLKWKYWWCVEIRAYTFTELLDGTAQERGKDRHEMTLDERVADEVKRSHVSVVVANNYHGKLGTVPDVIRELIEEGHKGNMAEEARVAAMSDEEREARTQEVLQQLRGSPGFMEFRS